MNERLTTLTSAQVKENLIPVEPNGSYVEEIQKDLESVVFGQSEAMRAIARRVGLFDSGLKDKGKPIGSMMFLGPTGVGKTEAARAITKHFFGKPDSPRLKIINCAELSQEHTALRLTGSPPSYVGFNEQALIPHDWLHKGRSVIVFDEIEKAHPAVHKALLSILDKGTLDARNSYAGAQPLDFSNSIILMTSNVGSAEINRKGQRHIGFIGQREDENISNSDIGKRELRKAFAPEFINRLDEIVVFEKLGRVQFEQIFWKFIDEANTQPDQKVFLSATEEFKDFVISQVNQAFGGRGLKRVLDREFFERAADILMSEDLTNRPLVADREGDKTYFYTTEPPPPPEETSLELLEEPQEIEEDEKKTSPEGEEPEDEPEGEDGGDDDDGVKPEQEKERVAGGDDYSGVDRGGDTMDIQIVIRRKEGMNEGTRVINVPIFPII